MEKKVKWMTQYAKLFAKAMKKIGRKDQVEIYITTNKGEDEKPLIKIASGGEMSRIMLAIKKALSEADQMPVMIFDEIDTGISGKAANAVADKLGDISKNHQVICISHLASIAANADQRQEIKKVSWIITEQRL